MSRDRSWMYNRLEPNGLLCQEFANKVQSKFLNFAFGDRGNHSGGLIRCPCVDCRNMRHHDYNTVGIHLCKRGFLRNYYTWKCQGEMRNNVDTDREMGESSQAAEPVQEDTFGSFKDMINDAFPQFSGMETSEEPEEPNKQAKEFLDLMHSAEKPIYEGNDQSLLQWLSELLTYKKQHNVSIAGMDNFISCCKKAAPTAERHKFPDNYNSVKKLMMKLGLDHVTYDVCENNCFLYYEEGIGLRSCPVCGKSRYKEKKNPRSKDIPNKKLWYFPITPRLQRLYMSRKIAKHMTWHRNYQGESEKVIHPAGSKAWKHFDETYPKFASESRNVRLGLSTDGFNPHGHSGAAYSCWPVFVTPYNLPPDLCMSQEYIFLTLLISGPKSPGMNIDVMLRPLIDELKKLWSEGALTYDSFKKQNFIMRASLLWTISDFPAYGMLSGWSTHGRLACPYCMERTKSFRLENGQKPCWFDCHRQFLHNNHPFRKNKSDFIKDQTEMNECPERRSGAEMMEQVNLLGENKFGKGYTPLDGFGDTHNWKKKSIFWELEYWPILLIRHNLDVMHCEKNFFENIKVTVFNDPGKSKDNVKARKDLELLTKRRSLFLANGGGTKRKAKYTLHSKQGKLVCNWLKELPFPDGFVSNISRCVNLDTNKITGMKSHDCHVFMQRLLPIAFRDFLPNDIWSPLVEVSNFFRSLCASEIKPDDMEVLKRTIVETICKLEKIFPPAFFDSMEHLAIHLPYEAQAGGPVFYRWMYPFERQMFFLKQMVKNKARVEGSICEAYLISEIANFCSHYFSDDVDTRITRLKRNEVQWAPEFPNQLEIFIPKGRPMGKPIRSRSLTPSEYKAAMYYILMNCEEVDPWLSKFDDQYGERLGQHERQLKRKTEFFSWFRKIVLEGDHEVDPRLHVLVLGAREIVKTYKGYVVNGFKFHTKDFGQYRKTMNSGVCVKATVGGEDSNDYYGMLQDVTEMNFSGAGYPSQKIFLFKCDWYDDNGLGTSKKYNLIEINPNKKFPTDDPFILANQASQVFYATYPSVVQESAREDMWVVCPMRARHVIDVSSVSQTAQDQDYYQDDDPPIIHESDQSECNLLVQLADDEVEIVNPDEEDEKEKDEEEKEEEDFCFFGDK